MIEDDDVDSLPTGFSALSDVSGRPNHPQAVVALVDQLDALRRRGPVALDDAVAIVGLLGRVTNETAFTVVWDEALPRLVALVHDYGLHMAEETALYLFKFFVATQYLDGVEEMIRFITGRRFVDGFLWSDIFDQLQANRPLACMVFDALQGFIPDGACGVALADTATALMREQALDGHPFDNRAGRARLRDWLGDTRRPWLAATAAAAVPFINGADQVELMLMAMSHPEPVVCLEAARSAALLGDQGSLQYLIERAQNPLTAGPAIASLQELDAVHRLPEEVFAPEFQAQVAMVAWLSDPEHFGQAPQAVSVIDRRRLYWPPLEREVELFLICSTYPAPDEDGAPVPFIGLVGSLTTVLDSDDGVDISTLSCQEIYLRHCWWELRRSGDPRATSRDAVRRLLAQHNPVMFG